MIGNLLIAVAKILDLFLSLFMWVLIIQAILSWISPYSRHPMAHLLYRITEPILGPVRRRFPLVHSGFDLSPMIVILSIFFLRHFLLQGLVDIARGL